MKKVTTNPAAPEINNGVYSFKAEFVAQEASMDGAPLYVYHTGYKITIPEGYVGVLTAADGLTSSSLSSATDARLFLPGKELDLFMAFRLTTNASPAMFKTHTYAKEATLSEPAKAEEEGSVFANLILIKPESVSLTIKDQDAEGGKTDGETEVVAAEASDVATQDMESTDIVLETGIDKENATDATIVSKSCGCDLESIEYDHDPTYVKPVEADQA